LRVETIPLIIGIIAALIGLGLLADAWIPEERMPFRERRRRRRAERHVGGEACIGMGVLCFAAALVGRDTWDYVTVAVLAGTVLVLLGAWLNRRYMRERIVNRGALRRGEGTVTAHEKDAATRGKTRIR
jgi:uncharacterized membrane protein YfcA